MDIHILETEEEALRCFPVMKALRPHLTKDRFIDNFRAQQAQSYKIAAVIDSTGTICALAGYRFCNFMAWGKIIYLDDIVTAPSALKKGYAGALLKWLEEEGHRNNCDALHLDSGYQRLDAHRLYLKKGWTLSSHHFSKEL